ncbi:aminotransferase class IV family protein [Candidatus Woesebacteria bacterium]|nr:aminotransferase class IV family protein [Candidatus Woesebacteria bacterium]
MQIFIDGQWVDHTKATISVQDIIVLRGFGIFDYLRTYGTNPFRLDDHIERFYNSARLMGMTVKYSREELTTILNEGIKRNGFAHTNVKFIQTGGISEDGFIPASEQTFFAYFYEATDIPQETYEKGISVKTSPLMRQLPLAKTINYAASIVEVQKALAQGAIDIIHTDADGNMYEATRANLFGVKDGVLITAGEGVLLGISRKVILEIAEKLQLPVEFRFIHTSEIDTLDEAFVSNSLYEVMPVTEIDGVVLSGGKAGEMSQMLLKEFRKEIQ